MVPFQNKIQTHKRSKGTHDDTKQVQMFKVSPLFKQQNNSEMAKNKNVLIRFQLFRISTIFIFHCVSVVLSLEKGQRGERE